MIVYRNTRTGRTVRLSEPSVPMDRSRRWERIAEPASVEAPLAPWPTPAAAPSGPFDPAEHTVTQVNAHLAGADAGERARVLQAEAEGRARRGILSGPHAGQPGT